MKPVLLLAAALAATSACATSPASKAEVAFVHGCWIARDEARPNEATTLRLLTMGRPGADYSGELLRYAGGATEHVASLSFAQDGSQMTLVRATDRTNPVRLRGQLTRTDAPALARGWKRAVFHAFPQMTDAWIVADGGPERLRIYHLGAEGPPQMLFDGARDGCD